MSQARSLIRPLLVVSALAGCTDDAAPDPDVFHESAVAASMAASTSLVSDIEREQVAGDVHHYSVLITVGDGPSDRIRLHRMVREKAPWQPRQTVGNVMLLHGDFSTFESNFAPGLVGTAAPREHGLAAYLAQQGIDVWGFDRRWTTTPPETTDFTGFEDMTMAAAVDDAERALLFARTFRGLTGACGRMNQSFIPLPVPIGSKCAAFASSANRSRSPSGSRTTQFSSCSPTKKFPFTKHASYPNIFLGRASGCSGSAALNLSINSALDFFHPIVVSSRSYDARP